MSDSERLAIWLLFQSTVLLGFRDKEFCFQQSGGDVHKLIRGDGVSKALRQKLTVIFNTPDIKRIQNMMDDFLGAGGLAVCRSDLDYPWLLRCIPDPPWILFLRGNASLLFSEPGVAVVGTRRMSAYGLRQVQRFVAPLAQKGIVIVSGLAFGVDRAAHEAALQTGGATIAVLAQGVLKPQPMGNTDLFEKILHQHGLIVSEFPDEGFIPVKGMFNRRNRLISGLSRATLVIEAARRSGSIVTARYAAEQGRSVFAVPGDVESERSQGCHDLIRMGAILVENAEQILLELPEWENPEPFAKSLWQKKEESLFSEYNDEAKSSLALQILNLLRDTVRTADELAEILQISVVEISKCLSLFEVEGKILDRGMGYFGCI